MGYFTTMRFWFIGLIRLENFEWRYFHVYFHFSGGKKTKPQTNPNHSENIKLDLPDSILLSIFLAHCTKASSTFSPVSALVSKNISSALDTQKTISKQVWNIQYSNSKHENLEE